MSDQVKAEDIEDKIVEALQTYVPSHWKSVAPYGGELENEEDFRRIVHGHFPAALVMFAGDEFGGPAGMGGQFYEGELDIRVFIGADNARSDEARRHGDLAGGTPGIFELVRLARARLGNLNLGVDGVQELQYKRSVPLVREKNVHIWSMEFTAMASIEIARDRKYVRYLESIIASINEGTTAGDYAVDGTPTGEVSGEETLT